MTLRRTLKIIIFILIIAVIMTVLGMIFIPKFYLSDDWATTCTYREFYEQEDNTDDVIFLGSSRGACAFDPIQMEDETGLIGYNLCCEMQNVSSSYYWLKEALRSQKPKVVVLDTNYLYLNRDNNSNLFTEGTVRKAIDNMHLSIPKLEMIRYNCSVDESQDIIDYIFPILRFHDRWQELSMHDIAYEPSGLRGYNPINYNKTNDQLYSTYEDSDKRDTTAMDEEMSDYLSRINELCKTEDIRLILVSPVSNEESAARHNTTLKWCNDNDCRFIDYNITGLYNSINYNFYEDNSSGNHANISGARKMTSYLSQIISEQIVR